MAGRFLITMNRRLLSDALDVKVIQKATERNDVQRIHKNYVHNPFLDQDDLDYINGQQKHDPARFKHMWLGEPDLEGHLPLLINARMVEDAFLAYRRFKDKLTRFKYPHTKGVGGLDIAGLGENFNCLIDRRGPVVREVDKWNKCFDHVTYRRVYGHATTKGCGNIHYDGSGVGTGFTSRHAEAMEEHHREFAHYPLKAVPENNGAAVAGKEIIMADGITNEGNFQYRGDQMGWMLVIRLQNTQRLLDGEDVDVQKCLFFDTDLDSLTQANLRKMLTQPTVKYNNSRQMHIQKMDETKGQESPDEFDALRLAYAPDSEYGINMEEWR